MLPKLNFIHISENALVAADGKVSIISIFNKLLVKTLPALSPKLAVVSNVSADAGEHTEIIKIISPAGQIVAKAEGKILLKENGNNSFIADFIGIVFPEEGEYKILVELDNIKIEGGTSIIVRKPEEKI